METMSIKKIFTAISAFFATAWDTSGFVEVPSFKTMSKEFTNFELMEKETLANSAFAMGMAPASLLCAWLRLGMVSLWFLAVFVVVTLMTVYKALTFWKKAK